MRLAYKLTAAAAVAATALAFGYVGLQGAGPSVAQADISAEAPHPTKVDNFRLTDENLQSHELRRLSDASAIVILTQMNGCPVSRNTASTLKKLKDEYGPKGVEFLMLNSTPQDKREEIQAEAKEYGYDVPILMDVNQLVGEQLGVTRTAQAFVIDPKTMKIIYRGPLDDRVTYERQKASADHQWAKDAIDSLIAHQPVAVAEEPAVGCLIDFPHRNQAVAQNITYVHDIAPIVEQKCVTCHQPGGIGPMPLTSYEKIKAFSPMIREVIRTQRMPPWRADPGVGTFHDDKSLSPDQIKTMVHWIEAGAPRGTGVDTLAATKFQVAEWPLGKPDLVLDIPAHEIPASGIVDYQHPWVANPLKEDKWVRASTIKVENRQGVHHILTGYLTDVPKPGEQAFEEKWGASMGGYAVGAESEIDPKNVGTLLPAGGAIGFQNHYTPYGKDVTEHSQLALYFYDKKPPLMMHNVAIANPNIMIPANTEAHQEVAYVVFPKDAILYSAFPHAHYRGASSSLTIRYPDGKEKILVALPKYDFNWQRDYTFETPVKVPAGSWLINKTTYDNSKRNPANPDPNRIVPWGDQSSDEMLYTALRYRWVDETSADPKPQYDAALRASRLIGMLDSNLDGKVEYSELRGKLGEALKSKFALLDKNHDGGLDMAELAPVLQFMDRHSRAPAPAPVKTATAATTAATGTR
jgi:mono/diheme cytochrome c family protein/peroxiredoxin